MSVHPINVQNFSDATREFRNIIFRYLRVNVYGHISISNKFDNQSNRVRHFRVMALYSYIKWQVHRQLIQVANYASILGVLVLIINAVDIYSERTVRSLVYK